MGEEMTSPADKPIRYPVDTPDIVRTDLLDIIDYQYRTKRDIDIVIRQPEFTSVCPMTGLPDFGTILIRYRPNKRLVELKSLKYYLLQYRNVGIFYEHVVNRILDDLVTVIAPKWMEIVGEFTARGGITSTISAVFETGSETDDGLVK